jgi:lipoprotein-anchoring transpeptidase ErfK/SrfK
VALSVLLFANFFANQALAEDVSSQPLTRIDCNRADMARDDNADVCGSLAAEAVPEANSAASQPLSSEDCDKSGMAWNDAANVCGTSAQLDALPNASNVADSVIQPLTREDCNRTNLSWNDSANVCGAVPTGAEAVLDATVSTPEAADTTGQPLTRENCKRAGMTWDDSANVCGAVPQAAGGQPVTQDSVTQTALEETAPITPTVLVSIDKASQTMTVLLDGVEQYEWPVSTGLRGYTTPSGTYTARSMNKIWYSRQWDNAPMPHAVFFTRNGHAIHGTLEVKRLGKPASHGCVRLSPKNAATLFALIERAGLENTQVVLAGSTPGGERKVASGKPRKKQVTRSKSREYTKRFGQRAWFRRYYATPRGLPPQPFYMGRQKQRGRW